MFKDRLKEKRQKLKQKRTRAKGDIEKDADIDAPRLASQSQSEQSQSESEEEIPVLQEIIEPKKTAKQLRTINKKRIKTTAEQRALSLLGKIDF